MFDLVKRENRIFEVLQDFLKNSLHFVIVGGYAVSAYKHRFSIDADLIIKKEDREKFGDLLKKKKFLRIINKKLDHVYAAEYVRFETREKPPASIDLLINGIGSRTTNASFSMEQVEKHSKKRRIVGTEKEITALVPDKEVLIALKLHSGRLTDFRDVAALCQNVDIELIKEFVKVGDRKILAQNIENLMSLIDNEDFINSFKGMFQEKKYEVNLNEVKKLKKLLG